MKNPEIMDAHEIVLGLVPFDLEIDSGELIQRAAESCDELEARKALWRMTADGVLDFSPGFKAVSRRTK